MARKANAVLRHLQNVDAELDKFDNELCAGLQDEVYAQLVEFVQVQARLTTEPMWGVVGTRCTTISTLSEQMGKNETQEQSQARIRTYLQTVNPGPIAQELQQEATFDQVCDTYEQVMARLEQSPDIGPIVRRYHLPRQAVAALCRACVEPLAPALEALGLHATQMKSHAELLQSISSDKGVRSGVGIAASVAGGLLLGPLGAIGARMLTGAAMDPTQKMNASAERVGETFEHFRATFVPSMESVDGRILYILVSLYGGLLLRLEGDLHALGRGLIGIDFDTGHAQLGLSPAALEDFLSWAIETLEQLAALKQQEDWVRLGDAADKALRLSVQDPQRATVAPTGGGPSYTVQFARMRAAALNSAADQAWRDGRFDAACALYLNLLSGTNIVWEQVDDDVGVPDDEAIHTAGLRLAMMATSPQYNGGTVHVRALAALPVLVAQATARFRADSSGLVASGEGLTGITIHAAMSISMYADQQGIDLGLAQRLPPTVRDSGGLAAWHDLFDGNLPSPGSINLFMGDDTDDERLAGSAYLGWIKAGSLREDRKVLAVGCTFLLVVGMVLVGGGYWLWNWYTG